MNDFETAFDSFLKSCQELMDDHMKQFSWECVLFVKSGRRYAKIIAKDVHDKNRYNSQRMWAFIDKTNGDILKPAGWKTPAKHARGNIYEEDRMLFMTPYGPAYMDAIKEYYGG